MVFVWVLVGSGEVVVPLWCAYIPMSMVYVLSGDWMMCVCMCPSCFIIGVQIVAGEIVVSLVMEMECLDVLMLYPTCWAALWNHWVRIELCLVSAMGGSWQVM